MQQGLCWKTVSRLAGKHIPFFCGTKKFITPHKYRPLDPIQSEINRVYTLNKQTVISTNNFVIKTLYTKIFSEEGKRVVILECSRVVH
jgi:hypothetical protein